MEIKRLNLHLKRGDIAVIAAVVFISFMILAIQAFRTEGNGELYVVIICGEIRERFKLDENKTVIIENEGYTLKVQIQDGYTFVISADCPDLECKNNKAISKDGSFIACVPARILVKITKDGDGDIDFMSG